MDRTEEYITHPTYIGAESLLTIQEEKALREAIASDETRNSFRSCQFYLEKSKLKLDYLDQEATAEFASIVDNDYSRDIKVIIMKFHIYRYQEYYF